MEEQENRKDYWNCTIGSTNTTKLKSGADSPLRNAVETAYQKLTGKESDTLVSGWGMTEEKMKVVNILTCMEKDDPIYKSIIAMLKGSDRLP